MNTAKSVLFLSAIFGLTTASPAFMAASAPRVPTGNSPSRADEQHLCTAPENIVYEYGNQTYQDRITADCEKLSHRLKTQADQQGNFIEACGVPAGFDLFGKEGDCTLWFRCSKTTEGHAVTMGYGDVADIIKLATDRLRSSGKSDNSSIVAVSTSFGCQQLTANWAVAL